MGRFFLGVGILTLFLAVGLWINSYVNSICDPLAADLSLAAETAEEELTVRAAQSWQKHRPLLAVFFDHAPLSAIDEGFSRLAVCRDTQERRVTCAALSRQLRALSETHRPSLENIL